jgi:hypothetical protein
VDSVTGQFDIVPISISIVCTNICLCNGSVLFPRECSYRIAGDRQYYVVRSHIVILRGHDSAKLQCGILSIEFLMLKDTIGTLIMMLCWIVMKSVPRFKAIVRQDVLGSLARKIIKLIYQQTK